MAGNYRAQKSGFAREVQQKLAGKFDEAEAAKTLRWIKSLKPLSTVSPEATAAVSRIPDDIATVAMKDYHAYLYDGLVLGYLIACIKAGEPKFESKTWQVTDKKVFETSRQRERIAVFLAFAGSLGVASSFLFQTDQLYEQTNLTQVVTCLGQVGIEAQAKPGYAGPSDFWTHKHQENKRNFTDEQMRSGDTVIGLQMGTNQGSNASGVSFGARRHIMDSH